MKKFLIDMFKGMIIGIANIIPGVSGGTMAVAMGIYEKLVKIAGNIFYSIFKEFKPTMKFLIPIIVGALIGVLLFSRIIEYTLNRFNMQTICMFVGLIIGTFPLVFKNANKNGFKKIYLLPAVLTGSIMILLLFVANSNELVFSNQLGSYLLLFVLGIIAAGTMVIPGISGSFVLMLLGAYAPILGLINGMNILLLIPFGIGVCIGIIAFSKIIDMLIEKAYGYTYYTIIGFILGSLPLIFKGIQFSVNALIPSVILLVLGVAISYYISTITKDN